MNLIQPSLIAKTSLGVWECAECRCEGLLPPLTPHPSDGMGRVVCDMCGARQSVRLS